MGIKFKLHNLPFPPRVLSRDYLALNPLGTVPFLRDGATTLTESSAMLLYLAEKYDQHDFSVTRDHPEYGHYLNWLFHSDATLTFPLTVVLRYSQFEAEARRIPQAVDDYKIWFLARLKRVNQRLEHHDYLVADKFTIADIAVGYALFLAERLGLDREFKPQTRAYLEMLKQRDAFKRSVDIGKEVAAYQIHPVEP
ncbi:glutathione S-transferase family protein [Ferrimonas gelatinilytica]|uniref:Glutathione S-transferase family protein n=2 Tax=Ferrimonas gelatinilytica TaxID=1255257 RepID=A0ABP9SEF1_9GAMM